MVKREEHSDAPGTEPAVPPRLVRLSWEPCDLHRWATVLALVGLAAAAALAIFGLPPVDLHPPEHRLGIMDPLCGGTRAARYTVQGRLAQAWRYNPLGIVAVIGAVITLGRASLGLITGRWVRFTIFWTPRRRRLTIGIAVVLIAALEVRQQFRADLLISGT